MNSESIKKVTNEAIEQLAEALNAGRSEALTCYLAAMAKCREYSFLNVLLILKACPNAKRVAGYKTWQSFGRQVKKGESDLGHSEQRETSGDGDGDTKEIASANWQWTF
jgi:N-terminal domain of anti-restriction factor ArdC